MSSELIHDNSTWKHKKEGYAVKIEHSQPHGVTTFRREVGLIRVTKSVQPLRIAKLRTKQTKYFLKEFVKA